jgi:hypothetical protein
VQPSEVTVEVVDIDGIRQGLVLPQYVTDLKMTSRLRGVGEWTMTLPAVLPEARTLSTPGAGILVTGPSGELFSGPVVDATDKGDQGDPEGSVTFTGVDHNILLADALAYPTPTTADVTAQYTPYDVRTGPAETVVRGIIDANIGPAAPAGRRGRLAQRLILAPDLARGGTVTGTSRFDPLLAQAAALTKLGGLGFRIVMVGAGLQLEFFQPADKSAVIRLDIANGRLTAYEHTLSAPSQTQVIVGGPGEDAARVFLTRNSGDSTAAETAWGRRIEVFRDERSTEEPTELAQAGDDVLADGGATVDTLKLTPTDDETMRYQVDWFLGDYITAVVRDQEIPQVVTQVGISVSTAGVLIGAVAGDLDAEDARALSMLRRLQRLETRT